MNTINLFTLVNYTLGENTFQTMVFFMEINGICLLGQLIGAITCAANAERGWMYHLIGEISIIILTGLFSLQVGIFSSIAVSCYFVFRIIYGMSKGNGPLDEGVFRLHRSLDNYLEDVERTRRGKQERLFEYNKVKSLNYEFNTTNP